MRSDGQPLSATTAAVLGTVVLWATSPVASSSGGVATDTLRAKVMLGYQGWFGATGDGCCSEYGWTHWSQSKGEPAPGDLAFDLWPDMAEYPPSSLFRSSHLHLANGSAAALYSPYVPAVIDVHFRWMREYGLDGIFAQRFIHDVVDPTSCKSQHFWRVLQSVARSASAHCRVWAIRYDLTGYNSTTAGVPLIDALTADWKLLVQKMGILREPSQYLHQDGRPVVTLTGIGMADKLREPATVPDAIAIAQRFRSLGCFTIAGTGYEWRQGGHDSHAGWQSAYRFRQI